MTPTAAVTTILLLYLLALFLSVATLWLFPRAVETVSQIETGLPYFVVSIIVVLPFVMLIFFGLAFLISDTISVRTGWLAAPEGRAVFRGESSFGNQLCRFIGVAMVALAQSDSAVHEDTLPDNNCDGACPHKRCCYLGCTPRPLFLMALH